MADSRLIQSEDSGYASDEHGTQDYFSKFILVIFVFVYILCLQSVCYFRSGWGRIGHDIIHYQNESLTKKVMLSFKINVFKTEKKHKILL